MTYQYVCAKKSANGWNIIYVAEYICRVSTNNTDNPRFEKEEVAGRFLPFSSLDTPIKGVSKRGHVRMDHPID